MKSGRKAVEICTIVTLKHAFMAPEFSILQQDSCCIYEHIINLNVYHRQRTTLYNSAPPPSKKIETFPYCICLHQNIAHLPSVPDSHFFRVSFSVFLKYAELRKTFCEKANLQSCSCMPFVTKMHSRKMLHCCRAPMERCGKNVRLNFGFTRICEVSMLFIYA